MYPRTSYSSYSPSRPAPPRPNVASYIPAGHPFSMFINPNDSTSSLASSIHTVAHSTGIRSAPASPSSAYSYASTSTACSTACSIPPRKASHVQSPTSNLAQPLSPRPRPRPNHLGHSGYISRPIPQNSTTLLHTTPGSTHSKRRPSPPYSTLPSELSILDHRTHHNLLDDIECVVGKKLRFPLLKRFQKGSNASALKPEVKAPKERDAGRRKLVKEKRGSWEEELGWEVEAVDVVASKGRGVREGNWL
ncbi:hypothetical protein JCM24511_04562 [Saitozyma sp. JCM 24511]|nr:hypothetical protein JCM24511_04562 [Saitozyma sp. JCM 24511]